MDNYRPRGNQSFTFCLCFCCFCSVIFFFLNFFFLFKLLTTHRRLWDCNGKRTFYFRILYWTCSKYFLESTRAEADIQHLLLSSFFPHLCQQLSCCQGNSCLIDHDNPRHLLIISWRERTNISPSAHKLCCQISPVFLTHLKKDARGRHNIIGCAKVGRPLSFEESIYGVLERWKLAPLHRGLSRCSPASLVGFD